MKLLLKNWLKIIAEEQLKSAHDDFDWTMTKDHDLPYTEIRNSRTYLEAI